MGIFKRFSLYLKVVNTFRPFFSNKERQMAYLETVEKDLPDAVISIYKEISKLPSKKYKKDRILYEQYFDKINKHNAEVTFIKLTINLWSFKKI